MYIPDLSPTDKLGQLLVTIIRFQCTECFSNAINLPVSQCLNMVMFIPKVDSSDGKVENSETLNCIVQFKKYCPTKNMNSI